MIHVLQESTGVGSNIICLESHIRSSGNVYNTGLLLSKCILLSEQPDLDLKDNHLAVETCSGDILNQESHVWCPALKAAASVNVKIRYQVYPRDTHLSLPSSSINNIVDISKSHADGIREADIAHCEDDYVRFCR